MRAGINLFIFALCFPAAGLAETNAPGPVASLPQPAQPQMVSLLPRERFRNVPATARTRELMNLLYGSVRLWGEVLRQRCESDCAYYGDGGNQDCGSPLPLSLAGVRVTQQSKVR